MLILGGALALGTSAGEMPFVLPDTGSEYVLEYTNGRGTHWDAGVLRELVERPTSFVASEQAAIHELRRRSGLTWDQIAELMRVSRRSVHLWASGKELSAKNQEHLHRVLAAVRAADRGSAGATRAALFATDADGKNAFDLLKAREHDDALRRLGEETKEPLAHGRRLVKVVRPMGSEPAPETLVGALHGRVHKEGSKSRVVRAAKAKKKACAILPL